VAERGVSDDAGRPPPKNATDPTLDEVLRAAGFEITEAGRERWRRQLATPISQEALDEAQRMLDWVRGRAA
jgi:hypothetical protein